MGEDVQTMMMQERSIRHYDEQGATIRMPVHEHSPGAVMKEALNILVVEDSEDDALLLIRELRRGGFEPVWERVERLEQMKAAIRLRRWDVIVSDYTLPHFSAPAALEVARQSGQDLPFIVVTGAVGEDLAVEAMKAGAHDYIMKGNLKRLPEAVRREIKEARVREERKRAEEALKESEQRYRSLFEESLTGNFISTPDGRILSCNLAFATMLGFSSVQEALDSGADAFYPTATSRQSFLELLRRNRKLEYYETEINRPDGKTLYAIATIVGVLNEKGDVVEIKGYLFDNTERKKLQEHLRQVEKIESLGTMASGIAHDFNNLLQIVLLYLCALEESPSGGREFTSDIGKIKDTVGRGIALVRQLLTFSRKTEVVSESTQVNQIIEELIKVLRKTFPKTMTIHLELDNDLPPITADPHQLHQVLVNLCVNARDAMSAGEVNSLGAGSIFISTGSVQGKDIPPKFSHVNAETYVLVKVVDTGGGMNKATMDRMFEPFFTTKGTGKGTGLGLAIVYDVVRGHNGFIDVKSEVGKGTEFLLYFPVPETVAVPLEEAKGEEVSRGGETILLVEDEPMVVDILTDFLEGNGYNVLLAKDGVEALEIFIRDKERIALVLSDLGLPKLGGVEVFKQMRNISPSVKVIFNTTYLDVNLKSELLAAGVADFVQKPSEPSLILKRVREVLDGSKEPGRHELFAIDRVEEGRRDLNDIG